MSKQNSGRIRMWHTPRIWLILFLTCMLILSGRFMYLALANKIDGIDLKKFAEDRITVKTILPASRGTIYDTEGNVLAINVASYTLIAYLDPENPNINPNPNHVEDKEATAAALAEALDAPYEYILERLEKNAYQVEFGKYGSKLTELKKLAIQELELPGIDFIESQKRFYPNGTFASYIIGYAKTNEDGKIVGEMGVESHYNETLEGIDGSLSYQKDPSGFQIPDTPEQRIEAIDGKDIYLTIDSSIQRFTEAAVKTSVEEQEPEWMIMIIADAKTGEILGASTSPSFDPNNLTSDMKYQNPITSFTYEPGSVMKTYSYLCALNTGKYDGEKTYMSGSYKVGSVTVHDWKPKGWGRISYDKGYVYSSNSGSMTVSKEYLTPVELRKCLESYGFGTKTGIELSNESSGSVSFNGNIEIDWLTVSFGQGGITATAMQQVQALTIIANDGVMVKPHIIKKIVDNKTGEEIETSIVKTGQVATKESTRYMRNLMWQVVNEPWSGGKIYKIDGFDVIGKTGTAQIAENGKYVKDKYIYSFAGMMPKDDPEIIVYAAISKPKLSSSKSLSPTVKEVLQNVAKYKHMYTEVTETTTVSRYALASYINQDVNRVVEELKNAGMKVIIIGDGKDVVSQYPKKGSTIVTGDKIFIVTNGSEIKLEDMKGWSRSDVVTYSKLINVPVEFNGYGYVTEQSIKAGEIVNGDTITIELANKYDL